LKERSCGSAVNANPGRSPARRIDGLAFGVF
jgi:hypothetical protein